MCSNDGHPKDFWTPDAVTFFIALLQSRISVPARSFLAIPGFAYRHAAFLSTLAFSIPAPAFWLTWSFVSFSRPSSEWNRVHDVPTPHRPAEETRTRSQDLGRVMAAIHCQLASHLLEECGHMYTAFMCLPAGPSNTNRATRRSRYIFSKVARSTAQPASKCQASQQRTIVGSRGIRL